MSDTLLVINLLSLGDWWGAYLESKRIGSDYYMAKSLILKGDTSEAIILLSEDTTCKAKRLRLSLVLSKFLMESAYDILKDSTCFTEDDKTLTDAYFLNFNEDDPLSDSLRKRLPKLLNPSTALILNIIPGLGMVYSGKPWNGIKTVLANIIGIGGIVYSIKKKHYVDAGIWYFFWENRFYFGSFQNTLEYVWEENRRRLRPYFEYIRMRIEKGGLYVRDR